MKIFKKRSVTIPGFCLPWLMVLPLAGHASFIETTLGTAVVNDATASYYNPAALMLIKTPQIIAQGSVASFHTKFTGQSVASMTGITETGSATTNTRYYSPSFYLGIPMKDKIIVGLAMVSNAATRDADENSILRYVQANNTIQDYDVVPALALKINECFSLGVGINFSYANFNLKSINGFPGSNIVDSQSHNQSDGTGMGANAGFLLKPTTNTIIGFNYRSLTSYHLSGSSVFEGSPRVLSNNYHFKLWTPARSVFSVSYLATKKIGLITTLQRIQWSAISNVHIYGIANVIGTAPVILNGIVPYYLRDAWLFTLGGHYRMTPKWIVRVAGSYNQSPNNPHYQIGNGDNIILGASMRYDVNKTFSIDGSYAHAFMKDQTINTNGPFLIQGVNQGARDAVSLKLTFNV